MITPKYIIDKYIGIPYINNGRDFNIGLDCWGLILHITKEIFGIDLPDAEYSKYSLLRRKTDIVRNHDMSYWVDPVIGQPEFGDFILINAVENLPIHVGIYMKENKFLHAMSGIGEVVLSEIEFWHDKIEGIYRLKEKYKSND